MRSIISTFLLGIFFITQASAETGTNAAVISSSISSLSYGVGSIHSRNLRGWDNLAKLLIRDGASPTEVVRTLSDSRMPEKEFLYFSLEPREPHSSYRKHNTKANRVNALKFYLQNKEAFTEAKNRYGVPEGVILSILQVETFCGKNTGRSSIFPALARLANAGEPANIQANIERAGNNKEALVRKRAEYLESTFLKHAVSAFTVAKMYGVSVHDLRGSFAGAMGIPQFLPGSMVKYGVDGNSDGKIDLYEPTDAILSTANYLRESGWNTKNLSYSKQRAVIWEYNRSGPYIDTVLAMAGELSRVVDRGVTEKDLTVPPNVSHSRKIKRATKAVRPRT